MGMFNAWVVALLCAVRASGLDFLNVKVLAQRREEPLKRLLQSLDAATYPSNARINVEIHVDAFNKEGSIWGIPSSAKRERSRVVQAAKEWTEGWTHGRATVVKVKENRGVRGQWLECSDPSLFGDEFARVLILEDDVELSPAWFEYLSDAVDAYSAAPSVAGISLQRQQFRLDGYAKELGLGSSLNLAPLDLEGVVKRNEAYLFAHVGSWGFSPDPWVWHSFLNWYAKLEHQDDPKSWSVGVAHKGGPKSGQRETLTSRWYRTSLEEARGERGMMQDPLSPKGQGPPSSMWTAHFDAFCAERGLFTVHARLFQDGAHVGLATSWREPGEHYSAGAKPESQLLSYDRWTELRNSTVLPREERLARVKVSGAALTLEETLDARTRFFRLLRHTKPPLDHERLFSGHRALLDVDWAPSDDGAVLEDVGAATQGFNYGYDPLKTLTQAEAICVLRNKRVVIVGDSISRYFTYALNYFLKFGTAAPEFGSECNNPTWGCADEDDSDSFPYGPSDYFDSADIWDTEGTDRSTKLHHRQFIRASFPQGIETTFYFIQDTWYNDLSSIASDIRNNDVLIVNSGWWELKEDSDDAGDCGSKSDASAFYSKRSCQEDYERDLEDLVDGVIRSFSNNNPETAALWRQTSCCGVDSTNVDEMRYGAIAAHTMNVIAERTLNEENVEVLQVNPLQNTANQFSRSWDNYHPTIAVQLVWVQLALNKIASQLERADECFGVQDPPTRQPTFSPSPKPTRSPTPRPSAAPSAPQPTTATCSNGVFDGTETDVDCGGDQCDKCDIGNECERTSDCDFSVSTCVEGVCSAKPTPTPTRIPPTAMPTTAGPTRAPTDSEPSLRPTRVPRPEPTRPPTARPVRDDGSGGYGSGDNVRDLSATGFQLKDEISYDQYDWSLDRCPTAGQKLLISLAFAALICHCIAALVYYSSIDEDDDDDYYQQPAPRIASGAPPNNNPGGRNLPPPPPPKKKPVKPPPPGGKKQSSSELEDELSNSALQVLRQMEDIEVRHGGTAPQLASIAETTDDGPQSTKQTRQPLSNKSTSKYNTSSRNQRNASGAHNHTRSSQRADGSSYVPRTNVSLVNKTLSINSRNNPNHLQNMSHSGRTSSYAEPHLNSRKASSVAFSFYDGGDSEEGESDDDDEDDEETVDDGNNSVMLSNGSRLAKERAAPPAPRGARTYAATSAAMELMALLVLVCVGEHRMPSGLLPAGTRTDSENPDLFTFMMAALILVSMLNIEVLEEGEEVFLSRAQANELKGWMQVAFVSYHYSNAQDVYVPIRWCVSAYIWLTGFGNGVFFWATADYSLMRFAQQIWRMNFLCLLLSLATGTPWIEYYFCALVTVHFVLIFLSCGCARLMGKYVFGWDRPDKKENREACMAEKVLSIAVMVGLSMAIWAGQTRDGYKGPYWLIFQWWMRAINEDVEHTFFFRTKMDMMSSVPGMLFGAIYSPFRDAWPHDFTAVTRGAMGVFAAALLAVGVAIAKIPKYCCYKDMGYHPYRQISQWGIGTLWIPLYLLCRNSTLYLARRISKPMEWIGMHSLEFYLLQFHVFMNKSSEKVLYIIPHEKWGYTNMALVGTIYVVLCVKALEITNMCRAIAWRQPARTVVPATLWSLGFYALLFDGNWSKTSCTFAPSIVWLFATISAVGILIYWTVKSL